MNITEILSIIISTLKRLKQFVRSFKGDDINKSCILLSDEQTYFNHNFLTCAKAEIKDLTVCIVVNGEKFQSQALTLTLIGHCPMSNSSELFSYTTICSSFKWIEPLFFELSHTHTHTHTHTDGHEYSIVAVAKPQL